MNQTIAHIALVVKDYDEAITFFTKALQFVLVEDTDMGNGKRWVIVSPRGSTGTSLLLARATTPEQEASIGNQTGGRVFLFLHTDDFQRDQAHMLAHGVKFAEEPRYETYGTVAVFFDIYGNKWDMIERK